MGVPAVRSFRLLAAGGVLAAVACQPVQWDSQATALRPDHPNFPETPSFAFGEVVETYVSPGGRVKMHFTRMGTNAVPARDDDMSGTPDYVELAASTYDQVRDLYHGPLGFREPVSDSLLGGMDDGGDDLFDVYLVDFAHRGDGAFHREDCDPMRPGECTGYMLQENDFLDYGYPSLEYACRVLASHEYFHAVQSAYDSNQDSIFTESTAVWATERFDRDLQDFEAFIEAYLGRTDRPINVVSGGVTDAKSYGTAIFFQFLSERYDPLIVRQLLEEVADGANGVADPEWYSRLDPFFARVYATNFADVFTEFSRWNLYTNSRANPAESYEHGADYPLLTVEDITLPYALEMPRIFSASARYFRAMPGDRQTITAALKGDAGDVEGLRLMLVSLRGGRLDTPVVLTDATLGTETIDTADADRVFAAVINTNADGNSKRPDLCIGTADEVRACLGGGSEADAGIADSGELPDSGAVVEADAGVIDAGSAVGPEPEDDGGCSAVSQRDGLGVLSLLLGLMWVLRRKRGA